MPRVTRGSVPRFCKKVPCGREGGKVDEVSITHYGNEEEKGGRWREGKQRRDGEDRMRRMRRGGDLTDCDTLNESRG